ncbi:ExeM/NucH family extracellular endonuclease [Ferrimonas kyonanensis]|uniref:ExeM/NucH family extracellular endonuclease n=1 Tax=Ferrimonas kyonanensis TaxID=364763 RepID=UPI0003FF3787|nr:ExeM/NucH family extracellular endonuclease [Ferrimonas kyonanensis]
MNKSILSLAVASVISVGAHAGVEDLLITEMTQATDAKVGTLEITNTGTDPLSLTGIKIVQHSANSYNNNYNNEMLDADGNPLLAGRTLAPNASLVIVDNRTTKEFRESFAKDADIVVSPYVSGKHNNLNINGDDGFYIEVDGKIVDRIGAVENKVKWATNTTLRRKLAADGTTPKQSATFDETQWQSIMPLKTDTLGEPNLPAADAEDIMDIFTCPANKSELTAISTIQGTGHTSPLVGQDVAVEGIITAKVSLPNQGFYLRDLESDGNPETSDGIFVSTSAAGSLEVGQTICIGSEVKESEGQTHLTAAGDFKWNVTNSSITSTTPTVVEVMESDDGSFDNTLERYEGMLVKLPDDLNPLEEGKQDMRVTRNYSFNHHKGDHKRNNIVLAYKRINVQPNHLFEAGSPESKTAAKQNLDYRLVLEDVKNPAYNDGQVLSYYPEFNRDAKANYIRIDDSVFNVEGVISQYETEHDTATNKPVYDYSLTVLNELQPTTDKENPINFIHNMDREDYRDKSEKYDEVYEPKISEAVEKDHFSIRVAGQNLLNFFNSPFGGDANLYGQSRGAESEAEYLKQREKLVKAVQALDADVLALMEMENNGFGTDSAIAEMVNQVNVKYVDERAQGSTISDTSTENRYVFVGFDHNGNQRLDNLDAIGKDSIATGIMYRPAKMSIERTRVIDMPRQKAPAIVNAQGLDMYNKAGEILEDGENYHRNALVVTFVINQTGKRLTLAVNHLKSKGSTCWEDWQGVDFGDETVWDKYSAPNPDLQGSCAEFRVSGAVHLGEEMEGIPGDKIILGDLNAYGKEDALLVLTENPRNKKLVSASHTFIGYKPQFNEAGTPANITKTYGYVDIVGKILKAKGEMPWSYSYSDVVGSLDHILITPSLEDRVIDAADWHINAPESDMYSYSNKYKKVEGTGTHRFYQDDVFRSSDHDPALLTLSYKHGEADPGHAVRLPKLKKVIRVPYQVPAAAGAQKGDVATISLSPTNDEARLDLNHMTLPSVVLTEDNQSLVNFQVFGAPSAYYHATLTLKRDGKVVEGSSQSFEVNVTGRDSLVADIVEEKSDGSGGSTGFISMLSLFGLAALRRRIRK